MIRVLFLGILLAGCGNGVSGRPGGNGDLKVFVTSQRWVPGGGLASADKFCNDAAQTTHVGGSYVAWLSDVSHDAIDRVTASGPWFLVKSGTKVFNDKMQLMATPTVALDEDELGSPLVAHLSVWTGTDSGGRLGSSDTCGNWTLANSSDRGDQGQADEKVAWTHWGAAPCSGAASLYCFEQQ